MSSITSPGLSSSSLPRSSAGFHPKLPCRLPSPPRPNSARCHTSIRTLSSRRPLTVASGGTSAPDSPQPKEGFYTVGDFMTRKEKLLVVKPSTSVDEALDALVENRITGFPVIDDEWKLTLEFPQQQHRKWPWLSHFFVSEAFPAA